MDQQGTLSTIINKLFDVWGRAVVVVVFGSLVIWFLLSYTLIKIDVRLNDGISKPAQITTLANGASSNPILIGGIGLVSRATTAIQAVSDNYKSIETIDVPLFGFKTVTIDLHKDKNATIYSSDSKDCLTYNQAADTLSSYDCTVTTGIYSYKAPANGQGWHLGQDFTLPASHSVTSYLDGVIGISSVPHTDRPIFFKDSNGLFKYFPLPSDMDKTQAIYASVATDKINSLNPHFILTTFAGDVYLGTLTEDSVVYTKYNHPADYDTGAATTICNLQDVIAYCYQGPSSIAPNPEGKSYTQTKISHFMTLTFSGNKVTYVSYDSPSTFSVDKLFVDGQRNIFATSQGNLYALTKQGSKLRPVMIATNVKSADVGTALFFVQSNDVYEVDSSKQQATLRFHSYRLTPTTIYTLGRDVFVNATADDAGNVQRTYKLNDELHTSATRSVDILPLSITASPDISNMTFIKDTISILLKVTIDKKAHSLAEAVSPSELATAKKNVLDQLVSAGIDPAKTTILFNY